MVLVQLCFFSQMSNIDIGILFWVETSITFWRKTPTDYSKLYPENDILKILDIFIHNIFLLFGGSWHSNEY